MNIPIPPWFLVIVTFFYTAQDGTCCTNSGTVSVKRQPGTAPQQPRARAIIFAAVANGLPNAAPIGIMDFVEAGGAVAMSGSINGLTPGVHGWHVHQTGDIGNGCNNAGLHFNPFNTNHGAPTASVRHVGDFGNLLTSASGPTDLTFTDNQVSLTDPVRSIIGRAIVFHAMRDDLGLGGNPGSLVAGNSGSRVACGVIGVA